MECHIFNLLTGQWTGWTSLVAQTVKNLPTMQETQVQSLGREDPLEKRKATHSSILAWRIPWTEEPDKLQSTGSQRVGHDWATNISGQVNYDFSTTKAWFLCLPIPPRWNILADSHQVGLKVFFKVSKINLPFLIIFILWIKVQRYWDSLHTLINPCWIMYSNFYLKI